MALTWKELEGIFHQDPKTIHWCVVKADPEKCTGCGLCVKNCPTRKLEMGEDNVPRVKSKDWPCFACYQCMVPCKPGAIYIAEPHHIDSPNPFATVPGPLPPMMPIPPRDAQGKPDQWNDVEKVIHNRRSVRNFLNKTVPEPLIRRVLEAGRAGPTAGNAQAHQFIVITDKALLAEIDEACCEMVDEIWNTYNDKTGWKKLALALRDNPAGVGQYDPRVMYTGIYEMFVKREFTILLGAPAVILLCGDYRAIGGAPMQIGIIGQNMTLVAYSLGLRASWVGFAMLLNARPDWLKRLGVLPNFSISGSIVLGYPKFKQHGVVPREFRPVNWWRSRKKGPEIDYGDLIEKELDKKK